MNTKRVELCIVMDLVNLPKYLLEECKEGATGPFAAISSEWTMESGHKLKYRRLHLDIRRNFFTMKVGKDCNRLPKGVVESPFSELLRARLDVVLSGLV